MVQSSGELPGHGTLQSDGWSTEESRCLFSLRQGLAIFAGSSFVVRLEVDNPSTPLLEDDDANTWFLSLRSMGFSTSFREVNLSAFESASLLGSYSSYSASKAVLGMLTATLQPLSFQPNRVTTLQLFFRTAQPVATGGAVRLQAPPGFDFGEAGSDASNGRCEAVDLDDSHYYAAAAVTTLRLPQLNCSASSSSQLLFGTLITGFNVAVVRLKARLFAAQMYGWQITVRAPSMPVFDDIVQSGLNYWHLYTENSAAGLVDGTPSPIALVGQDLYRLHYRSLSSFDLRFSSLQPLELSGQESMLQVSFRLGGIPLSCALV